jgi:predicted MPP superfamily phosphohydrolase
MSPSHDSASGRNSLGRALRRAGIGVAAAGVAAAAYMTFEAQWVECRRRDLIVPGLPRPWSGLTILHLADVHAGLFAVNERSLAKVVEWAAALSPDLVFLTGDILGEPAGSGRCLDLLARLHPGLGSYAVTGNHEYGLSKAPLARPRDTSKLWDKAGINLLSDSCVALPPREGCGLVLCGADFLTRGESLELSDQLRAGFPILLAHEPPPPGSLLAGRFPLAFAGHTHGGQLRLPARSGLSPLGNESDYLPGGVHPWGESQLVVTRGIGTSFLPFRLLTRPEATLWRLVYTSRDHPEAPEGSNEGGANERAG